MQTLTALTSDDLECGMLVSAAAPINCPYGKIAGRIIQNLTVSGDRVSILPEWGQAPGEVKFGSVPVAERELVIVDASACKILAAE